MCFSVFVMLLCFLCELLDERDSSLFDLFLFTKKINLLYSKSASFPRCVQTEYNIASSGPMKRFFFVFPLTFQNKKNLFSEKCHTEAKAFRFTRSPLHQKVVMVLQRSMIPVRAQRMMWEVLHPCCRVEARRTRSSSRTIRI